MESVNVKTLFLEQKNNLPSFVNKKNLVYICRNLINGKVYVGETNDTLYNRWCSKGHFSHKSLYEKHNRYLIHIALHKYGIENFEISILEEGFNSKEERKLSEQKWIEFYHSYIRDLQCNGYNMTKGGDDGEQLHTPESHKKAVESNKRNHGGILAFNTKECHEKSIATNRKNHGGILSIHLPEVRKKALESNRRNHKGKLAFQSKESRQKAMQTQYKKYGKLVMHLPENQKKAIENQKKKYNGVLAMNLPENIEKMKKEAPKWRMIYNIQRHIDYLKKKNLEINAKNYIFEVWDTKRMWQQHIPNVLNKLNELRKLSGWTEEMEKIFSKIEFCPENSGVEKLKIKE